jgi:hypothetical protein
MVFFLLIYVLCFDNLPPPLFSFCVGSALLIVVFVFICSFFHVPIIVSRSLFFSFWHTDLRLAANRTVLFLVLFGLVCPFCCCFCFSSGFDCVFFFFFPIFPAPIYHFKQGKESRHVISFSSIPSAASSSTREKLVTP